MQKINNEERKEKRKNEETSCNKEARREEGKKEEIHKGIIEEMAYQTMKENKMKFMIFLIKKVMNACMHTCLKNGSS